MLGKRGIAPKQVIIKMKKLTGAIIGCGAIAREHLTAVGPLDNVEIAAVCDLSIARAEAAAERFGVTKWYTSYQQLLSEVRPDLVHITTSPLAHFPIACACLSAGLNVLCEKPITVDYQEFSRLKQMAVDHQCLLMENQNLRFHSAIQRIQLLLNAGVLGEIVNAQICLSLGILGNGSPYIDSNQTHSALSLRGGVIGDFLPHIAYLAYIFTGPIIELRTTWIKRTRESPLPFDEFCGLIKGERATSYVSFSGNSQPDGFWVRVTGTRAHVETNLFEPPRLTIRRVRAGEPAFTRLVDGIAEGRDVLKGAVASFWRKLAGTNSYDGLPELIARTYNAVEKRGPPPVPLDEIDAVAQLVDRFTAKDFML
jgi:predicted dehydrogenase